MKITEEQVAQWYAEYFASPLRERYEIFMVNKAVGYALERAASVCDGLRVGGTTEWQESHLQAVQALTEAATAIRALKEGE